jgi:putative ABC transport system permease protein
MAPVGAVDDLRGALADADGIRPSDFDVVAAQSFVPVDARQTGEDGAARAEQYAVRGLDDAFVENTTYNLSATARGYRTDAEVWQAMGTRDGLAVVDGFVAPRRSKFNFGPAPDFALRGFYVEDGTFDPVPVEVTDPQTGATIELTVIGVLADNTPQTMLGIFTSQATLAPLGDRAVPTVHYFKTAPGVDPEAAANRLETAFLGNGMEAETMASLLDEAVGASWMFNRLIQGFLGFQRSMVRRTFVLEASFVALLAIVIGTSLGLVMAYNVVKDSQGQPGNENLAFAVPWLNLLVVFAAVYGAALLATSLPARKAAAVYPAEALRYE